jgi:hypothetical protein
MAQERRTGAIGSLTDRRYEHTMALLWHGLNYKIRVDAIRENDGPRIITHWRFDLIDLFNKHHPKYVIMAAKLLLNVSGGGSERLAKQLMWNRTINVNGGRGKNVSKDFYNEVINKKYKGVYILYQIYKCIIIYRIKINICLYN